MEKWPSHSCLLLWAGALFHASSAEITMLYLMQESVCARGFHPSWEGVYTQLPWEGALSHELGGFWLRQ